MKEDVLKPYLKLKWNSIYHYLNLSRINKDTGKRIDDSFVLKIANMLLSGHTFKTRLETENIAEKEFGITDKKFVKELSELAIVVAARKISSIEDEELAYEKLVDLYKRQPMATLMTGVSLLLGQFSTPIPMSFIMGKYILQKNNHNYYEPTAGNGMLTIASKPINFTVNELDKEREYILKKQGFKKVTNLDALNKMPYPNNYFDGCLSNPPFGTTKQDLIVYGFKISGLEQQIIVKSLDLVKNTGKSAFIIGGHTEYDEKGRLSGSKNKGFLSFLSKFYFLDDVINISGKLYGRQGTFYPTRIILISGRKTIPDGFYPLLNKNLDRFEPFSSEIIENWDELWIRTKKWLIKK